MPYHTLLLFAAAEGFLQTQPVGKAAMPSARAATDCPTAAALALPAVVEDISLPQRLATKEGVASTVANRGFVSDQWMMADRSCKPVGAVEIAADAAPRWLTAATVPSAKLTKKL